MINTNKHYEFFQPDSIKAPIHIVGCGAIGSTLGTLLAKLGLTNIVLWDDDIVEAKNVANQMYRAIDIGQPKTAALKKMMTEINPDCEHTVKTKGWYTNEMLEGYVFMAVDSVEIRKKIIEVNKYNTRVIAVFDYRMRLEDAQHYAADWNSMAMKDALFASLDFTQEEADEQTPMSACHETLSIFYTIMGIVSEGVNNFVQFVKDETKLNKMIFYNAKWHAIDAFPRDDLPETSPLLF